MLMAQSRAAHVWMRTQKTREMRCMHVRRAYMVYPGSESTDSIKNEPRFVLHRGVALANAAARGTLPKSASCTRSDL